MSYLYLSDDDTITAVNRSDGSVVFRRRQNPATVGGNTDSMGGGAVDESGRVWLLDVAYSEEYNARLLQCDANLKVENRYDLFATPELTANWGIASSDFDFPDAVWWANGFGYIGNGRFLALMATPSTFGTGLFAVGSDGGVFNKFNDTREQASGLNTDSRGHGWWTQSNSSETHFTAFHTANETASFGFPRSIENLATVESRTLTDLSKTIVLADFGFAPDGCIAVLGGPDNDQLNAVYISSNGDSVWMQGVSPFHAKKFYSGLFPDSDYSAGSACIDTDPDYFWVIGSKNLGSFLFDLRLTKVNIKTGDMPIHSAVVDPGSSEAIVYSMWTKRIGNTLAGNALDHSASLPHVRIAAAL